MVFLFNLARIMDQSYKATKDLYGCNPRAFYEMGIKPVLDLYGVPCTQSAPLNVAKATKAITLEWADKKTPLDVGRATYRLAKFIDSLDKADLEALASHLGNLLMQDAVKISSLNIESDPLSDSFVLGKISEQFILEALDGGNTPQRIVGTLLELHQEFTSSKFEVHGVEDSASTTNLTSKKPGDLSITNSSGSLILIYEVTLKEFTEQRITECSQSLIGVLGVDAGSKSEVIVLCRKQDVLNDLLLETDNTFFYGRITDKFGIRYNFIDVFNWIKIKIIELDQDYRIEYFSRIEAYVNRVKTPVKVKNKWAEILKALNQD